MKINKTIFLLLIFFILKFRFLYCYNYTNVINEMKNLIKEIISEDSSGYEYYLTYKSNNKFLRKKNERKKLEENKDELQFIMMSQKNISKI